MTTEDLSDWYRHILDRKVLRQIDAWQCYRAIERTPDIDEDEIVRAHGDYETTLSNEVDCSLKEDKLVVLVAEALFLLGQPEAVESVLCMKYSTRPAAASNRNGVLTYRDGASLPWVVEKVLPHSEAQSLANQSASAWVEPRVLVDRIRFDTTGV